MECQKVVKQGNVFLVVNYRSHLFYQIRVFLNQLHFLAFTYTSMYKGILSNSDISPVILISDPPLQITTRIRETLEASLFEQSQCQIYGISFVIFFWNHSKINGLQFFQMVSGQIKYIRFRYNAHFSTSLSIQGICSLFFPRNSRQHSPI